MVCDSLCKKRGRVDLRLIVDIPKMSDEKPGSVGMAGQFGVYFWIDDLSGTENRYRYHTNKLKSV